MVYAAFDEIVSTTVSVGSTVLLSLDDWSPATVIDVVVRRDPRTVCSMTAVIRCRPVVSCSTRRRDCGRRPKFCRCARSLTSWFTGCSLALACRRARLPPLRVIVNKPFVGPASLAFGVVAATETTAGSSAMLTVAEPVPIVYAAFDEIVSTTVSVGSTMLSLMTCHRHRDRRLFAGIENGVLMTA